METSTIVLLVLVFAIYILMSEYYFKRYLGIKLEGRWMFSDERNKLAVWIDGLILILFIGSMWHLNTGANSHLISPVIRMSPMFGLFFLQNLNQGIEERLTRRDEKRYYHNWLASFVMLVTFIIFFVGEYE
ncbi:DUF4181 domain-containing protein [Pseudalkalibacillus sp. Hm43]|uniref:DUF4181 domain-containing protein n=1 Tax=Pseudalkalibacillus sp. Hm43 TaxID=3450742 RepID=UPI003F43546D